MQGMEGLTWYERAVLKTLRDLYQYSRNYVHTRIIAGFLDKNDRIVRGVLVRLEHKQVVQRKGQRGGWKPLDARTQAAPHPVFVSPRLVLWHPPEPHPKPLPNPIMLESYLTTAPLQAVM